MHSISLAASGTVAASTADGRVWIGHGGEKKTLPPGSKKKRSRKWEGLKSEEGIWIKVAEGPIVSVLVLCFCRWIITNLIFSLFNDSSSLTTCTLLGTVTNYRLADGEWSVIWTTNVKQLAKVNCMQFQGSLTVFGGFDASGKGVVEVLRQDAESA